MQVLVYPHTIPADLPEKLKDMTHADGKTKLFPWISNNTGMMLKVIPLISGNTAADRYYVVEQRRQAH